MIEINTYEESLALYNSDPETWEEVADSMGHGWMHFQENSICAHATSTSHPRFGNPDPQASESDMC